MAKGEAETVMFWSAYSLAGSSSGAEGLEGELLSTCASEGAPGTRNSSLAQRPKSMSLQRSEQKGRAGLSFHSVGLPQVGHFIRGNRAK